MALVVHSIAICTADRVEELVVSLEQMVRLVNKTHTEILIINNGKESDTDIIKQRVKKQFSGTSVIAKVLYEATPGLSSARNKALEQSVGEIITMIDDDAYPLTKNWQETILKTFRDRPNVGLLGGPSILKVPDGVKEKPWWRSMLTDQLMSCSDGPGTGQCIPDDVIGVNASYRKSAIRNHRFNTKLGWNNHSRYPFCSEETLFHKVLAKDGWLAWFDQDMPVVHNIVRSRFNHRWPLRRSFIGGRTAALFGIIFEEKSIGQIRKEAYRTIIMSIMRASIRLLQGNWSSAYSHANRMFTAAGFISLLNEWKTNSKRHRELFDVQSLN
jgi:glycosyltransferase involved in cell wall biosynthesis